MFEELYAGASIGFFVLGLVFSAVLICLSAWFWHLFWKIFSKSSGAKAELKFIETKKRRL